MTESRFKLETFCSDTMLNHHLSQKLKLIRRVKFNYLIDTLKNTTKIAHCALNTMEHVKLIY
jgi:hypothetical protein